jgi:RimJ/RimL family protein N-acetyltransferase
MFAAPIDTPRLRLRPWRDTDLDGFHGIWGDPAVIWWTTELGLDASRAGLARVMALSDALPEGLGWLAVVEKDLETIVGDVMVQPAPFAPGDFELGYHFAVRGQRQGFATEAARALRDHVFLTTTLPRVVSAIVPTNAPSLRVAARLGMRPLGQVTHAGLLHLTFALTRDAFQPET